MVSDTDFFPQLKDTLPASRRVVALEKQVKVRLEVGYQRYQAKSLRP